MGEVALFEDSMTRYLPVLIAPLAINSSLRFGCVLADAGYGLSAPFRQGLTARKLTWAVGIPRHLKVYPADVRMVRPVARCSRPRQRHVPDILSMPADKR